MADFVTVVFEDGAEVMFQSAEGDLVNPHGGAPVIERYEASMDALGALARSTQQMAAKFAQATKPDEIALEIGIGLSGEVGWFFAKSEMEASLKLTLTWKADALTSPVAGSGPAQ